MNNKILKYVTQHCSTVPQKIDRLFISVFLQYNNISVKNNMLIKSHIIISKKGREKKFLEEFISLLNQENIDFSIEFLIELFELVISPADKVVSGAVYTPLYIREYIISQTLGKTNKEKMEKMKICDFCCGCGGFLFNAAKYIKSITNISYKNIFEYIIYGLDIKGYSIQRTKLLLSLLALSEGEDKEFQFNLFVGDALSFSFNDTIIDFRGFDIILGNPPYVCSRKLDKITIKKILNFSTCKSGHPDLYIPFFQIGIENLANGGLLGYITMNSFLKSLNGRNLRDYFQDKKNKFQIIDFGTEQVFKSHNTYTCICIIQNTLDDGIEYTRSAVNGLFSSKIFSKILYAGLNSMTGWNLQNNEIITKIESTGIPLGKLVKMSHGIATLKNNIFIFTPIKEDKYYYYLKSDIEYPIEKNICKNIINSNRLNRIHLMKEKIIFPYNNDTIPYLFTECFFKKNYPKAYYYLISKKNILMKRDKGKGNYQKWFAFGRTQALKKNKNKLLFPKMSNGTPKCIINVDNEVLYYNGQAMISSSIRTLNIIKKIVESRLFWYYITSTSKPYASGYYSLNGNYIKNFGLYEFTHEDEEYLINESNKEKIDIFLEKKYNVFIS